MPQVLAQLYIYSDILRAKQLKEKVAVEKSLKTKEKRGKDLYQYSRLGSDDLSSSARMKYAKSS